MSTVFDVLSCDDCRRQSVENFRVIFLDPLGDLKAVDEEVLAASARVLDAVEDLKACGVVEVGVVVVRA
jgi:hypothetical protein